MSETPKLARARRSTPEIRQTDILDAALAEFAAHGPPLQRCGGKWGAAMTVNLAANVKNAERGACVGLTMT